MEFRRWFFGAMRITERVRVTVDQLHFFVTVDHEPDGRCAFVYEKSDLLGRLSRAEITDH